MSARRNRRVARRSLVPSHRAVRESRAGSFVSACLLGAFVSAVTTGAPLNADERSDGTTARADVLVDAAWFRGWAARNHVQSLRASFQSEIGPGEIPRQRFEGTWSVRVEPIFGEKIEFQKTVAKDFGSEEYVLAIEEAASWDPRLGEGRVYQRQSAAVRGFGTRTRARPKTFGRIELPSDTFFLFRTERPLSEFLATMTLEVTPIEGTSRFAAFVYRDTESVLNVFVLDPALDQPIVAFHGYMPETATPLDVPRTLDGSPIVVPEPFRDYRLIAKKTILESREIDGVQIPVAWRVDHCFRLDSEVVTVRLDPDSIELNGAADEEIVVEWPSGVRVYDYGKGQSYWVGEESEPVKSEVAKEAELDLILETAGFPNRGAGSANRESAIPSGCASNSVYVALALLEKPVALGKIVSDLGISADNPVSSVATILESLKGYGIDALAVRGDSELLETPAEAPLLLHATRIEKTMDGGEREAGHFLVIDDFDESNGTVRVFDPPRLPYRSTLEQVEKAWTGTLIALHPDTVASLESERTTRFWMQLVFGALGIVLIAFVILSSRRKRPVRRPVATAEGRS